MITEIYKKPVPDLDIDDKFYLREHKLDDVGAFFEYYTDPTVSQYILATIPKTLAEAKEEIIYCRNLFYYKRGIYWSICRRDNDKMIGAIGLYMNNNHHRAEICYDLHKDFWRQGITSKAIAAVARHLFTSSDIKRIEALTVKENIPSINILKKLGFEYDGSLKNYRYYNNKSHDVEMLSITPEMFFEKMR